MKRRWILQGALVLCLLFPPVFLIPENTVPGFSQDAAAGLGGRIRKIAKKVVAEALAGVSTAILQAEAAIQRAQQLKYAIDQYRRMLKNAKRLSKWDRQGVQAALLQLDTIAKQGEAIAYSAADLDEKFRAAYQGFEHHLDNPRTGENWQTYADLYRDWTRHGHDSIRGSLRAAGLQAQQFQSETATVRQLEDQLMSAQGTQQALQAGSLIASHQVSQLQKLRQLLMSQVQIQGNYSAVQLDRQALEDATLQRLLAPTSRADHDQLRINHLPFQ